MGLKRGNPSPNEVWEPESNPPTPKSMSKVGVAGAITGAVMKFNQIGMGKDVHWSTDTICNGLTIARSGF